MKQRPRRILLRKLLLRASGNKRLWPALIALCMGTVLLLYAVILWTGFRDILAGKYDKDSLGATYITVSKKINAQDEITKQKPALFTTKEIRALSGLPGVLDVGMFTSARFPVEVLFTGQDMKFSTHLFIESVPERFIDDKPLDWAWQYSSPEVPVIVSNEFLNLYNFGYAPNQGVPQLTKGTIGTLVFTLKAGHGDTAEEFNAKVVGFSDRISSILVPQSFIDFGNEHLSGTKPQLPSRLILQVKDASDEIFVSYLKERDYVINNELLRWNKLRTVVYAASMGLGLLAIILVWMGTMIFILFARLTTAAAKQNLRLLIDIGYSPHFLSRFMYLRYVLIILAVMVVSGIAAIYAQVRTAKFVLQMNLEIATFPSWEVWTALAFVTVILLAMIKWVIEKGVR